jgi:hypothetical protein
VSFISGGFAIFLFSLFFSAFKDRVAFFSGLVRSVGRVPLHVVRRWVVTAGNLICSFWPG